MAKTITFTDIPTPSGLTCIAVSGGTLAANTTYYYTVIGVFSTSSANYVMQGKSLPSIEVTGRTTTTNRSITLTFNIPKGSAFAYRVWRHTSSIGTTYFNLNTLGTFPTDAANNTAGVVTWTDTGFAVGGNTFFEPYTHGKLVLAGSTSSDKFSIVDLYNDDVANGRGLILRLNSNTYICNTHIVLNPSNYWLDTKKTIVFADGITPTSANLEFGTITGERTANGCNIDITTGWLSNFNCTTLNAYRTVFRYNGFYGGSNTGLNFFAGVVRDCQVDYFRNFVPGSSVNCIIRNFTCSNYDNLFSSGAATFLNLNLMVGSRVFQTGTNTIIYAKGVKSTGSGLGLYVGLNSIVTVVDSTYDNIGSALINSTGTQIRDKFSYNLNVTKALDGVPISGATVKIYDKFNNLITDVITDSNGNIVEQEILRKQYDIVNLTITSTDYFPHKTVISSSGYNDYIEYTSNSSSIPVIKSVALSETQPLAPQIIAVDITNPSADNNDGVIIINTSGGTGALLYSIDALNYQSGSTFNGLSAGTYTICVKDSLDLQDSISGITLTAPAFEKPVIISIDIQQPTAVNNDGIMVINVTGGTPAYQYSIGVGYQTGNTFTGLSASTYVVSVKDSLNLVDTISGITLVAPAFEKPIITSIDITNPSVDNNDGIIAIHVSGGTSPYEYSIGSGYQTGNTFTNLSGGTYSIGVKDANNQIDGISGIELVADIPIIPKINSVIITDSKSTIESTGSIKILVSGGTSPYLYKLNDGNYQISSTFTGLPANTYNITIKDSLNQIITLSGIKVGATTIGGASGRGWNRRKYTPEVNVKNISIKDKDNDLKEEIKIRVTL
jgi:hypothetical protein